MFAVVAVCSRCFPTISKIPAPPCDMNTTWKPPCCAIERRPSFRSNLGMLPQWP